MLWYISLSYMREFRQIFDFCASVGDAGTQVLARKLHTRPRYINTRIVLGLNCMSMQMIFSHWEQWWLYVKWVVKKFKKGMVVSIKATMHSNLNRRGLNWAPGPGPVAENIPQPTRLNVEENVEVLNPQEPRNITGGQCNDNQFVLEDRIEFVRNKQDCAKLLHSVTKSGPYCDDNKRGKALFLHLVRQEFSNDTLATRNATGQTKENRRQLHTLNWMRK